MKQCLIVVVAAALVEVAAYGSTFTDAVNKVIITTSPVPPQTTTTTTTIKPTTTVPPTTTTTSTIQPTGGIGLGVTTAGQPHFLLRDNGNQVASVTVNTSPTNYLFTGNFSLTDTIEVQFDNDSTGVDLFITSLSVNGASLDLSKATHLPVAFGGWEGSRFALYVNDTMAVNGTPSSGSITPSVPINFRAASLSSTDIELNWSDTNTVAVLFAIERSPTSTGPWNQIASTGLKSYTDSGLTPSTTYNYRARAVTP